MSGRVTLEIRVMGEFEVRVGRSDRTPTGRLPRMILSVLTSRLGDAIHTDALIESVWDGSAPKSARSSLRVHISRIRRSVGLDDLLATTENGYRLQADPQSIDVYRFEMGVKEGRRLHRSGLHGRAAEILRAALGEWRGEPYEEANDLLALQSEIRRLTGLKREAEVDLAAALEAAGENPDVPMLEAMVDVDPLDERRWGLLMRALYRSGRQADALAAFRRASRVLADELGLEPGPELCRLEEQILLHDPELRSETAPSSVTLPGFATSLVGRAEEVRELGKLLADHRLVTVTGLGGVGKTRLATAAAVEAAPDFPAGAAFVALDRITDGGSVVDAVVAELGLPPSPGDPLEALVGHVAGKRMLLVLDNCEHVSEQAAALATRLVRACEHVTLLSTSRQPLSVTGETLFSLNPLRTPPTQVGFGTPGELLAFESVALFCERARQARPGFTIDRDTGPVVAEIVRRLAGIPLPIEIAAAHSDLLTPADILDRIGAGLETLPGGERDRAGRHQTMADAIAWSLDLLDETAAELFRRLAVFHTPVTSSTIEAVCSDRALDAAAVHGSLAALVRSSLVTVDLDGAHARYSQLPPIRQVAVGLLRSDEQQMRDRHLAHFAQIAAAEVGHVAESGEAASFQRLTAALDELRAALHHAAASEPETGGQMCIDLGTYWLRSGRTGEGRDWVRRFLDEARPRSPEIIGSLYHLAGSLALVEQELDEADEALTRALVLRRDLDAPRDLGMTLSNLGGLANSRGEYERAESLFREALEVFAVQRYERGAAAARLNLGLSLLNQGATEAAVHEFEHAIDGFRRIGDRAEEGHALSRLGFTYAELGDIDRAEACRIAAHRICVSLRRPSDIAFSHMNLAAHYHQTADLQLAREHISAAAQLVLDMGLERWWVPDLLELAAGVAVAGGDPEEGARLFGCAGAHRRARNVLVPAAEKVFLEDTYRQIEKALGRRRCAVEMEAGGTRSLREGVREVADWA